MGNEVTSDEDRVADDWADQIRRWKFVRVFGLGALVAGAAALAAWLIVAAVLIGPLIFWLAWNVLDFGPAIGLPELGVMAILLATIFLVVGWFGKVVIAGILLLANPSWLQAEAVVHWPEPTWRNFLAIALLALLAATPHASEHRGSG
ncbi:MAG: hypothetical protein ACRBK7_09485 [Acidimicrobiales bacterium]